MLRSFGVVGYRLFSSTCGSRLPRERRFVLTRWRKSSYSKDWNQALCVEVATDHRGGRLVRDSKNPDGHVLEVTDLGWSQFVQWMRRT